MRGPVVMRARLDYDDGTSEVVEFTKAEGGWLVPKQDVTLRIGRAFLFVPLPELVPDEIPDEPSDEIN